MKISVVIPVYNVEKYIRKCLDSVVNQTFSNLEIILVDDGSTDESGAICDEYAQKDKRITVIHKANGGLVSARKAGVRLATGDYVSYVDSDDWIDLDMYQNLIYKMGDARPDVVTFNFIHEYKNSSVIRMHYLKEDIYTKEKLLECAEKYRVENVYFYTYFFHTSLWSKLIKKNIIQKHQEEIDNKITCGEDCVSYACVGECDSLQVLDIAPYHYNVRKESITRKRDKNEYNGLKLLCMYLRGIIKNYPFLKTILIHHIYMWLLTIGKIDELILKDSGSISILPYLKKNMNVVIYGKGNIGQTICNTIEEFKLCTIVKWIDNNDIQKIKDVSSAEYDFVIIAVSISDIVKSAEKNLIGIGVPEEKIMRIESQNLVKDNLPKEIRDILNN